MLAQDPNTPRGEPAPESEEPIEVKKPHFTLEVQDGTLDGETNLSQPKKENDNG